MAEDREAVTQRTQEIESEAILEQEINMDKRTMFATTVGTLGACLLGYVGRCLNWYWNDVLVPEPFREYELLIHQGNVSRYGQLSVNPNYYVTLVVKADGTWVRVNGQLIPYEEWLERDVYVRSRAPMTKGQYRIGPNA